MSSTDKIAILGHNGWAARDILKCLASRPFTQPIRILARVTSNVANLPKNTEVARFSWSDDNSISRALEGVDVLLSFVGPEGLLAQKKLVPFMKDHEVKLFAPSDLALPYTSEERQGVQVPRDKEELDKELTKACIPSVTICIGNFTSFALDSPYMGVDIPNNRILHTGESRTHPIYLRSLAYVAAGYASMFFDHGCVSLAGRAIGLNELHPTTGDIEDVMWKNAQKAPLVAYDFVENAMLQAKSGRLDALVRKKMGDGTHGVGDDLCEVPGFQKRTLEDFVMGDALEAPRYVPASEETRTFLDQYFR